MKKITLIAMVGIAILVLTFVLFNQYIYTAKQAPSNPAVTAYRGTLTGTYLCLPHTNTSGPQTLECALGMQTDSGEYYALDFSAMSQPSANLISGQRFTASGLITPIELLSTDHWEKYPVEGIFSVTDSVQKL